MRKLKSENEHTVRAFSLDFMGKPNSTRHDWVFDRWLVVDLARRSKARAAFSHFSLAIHFEMLQCEVFESRKTDISKIDWAMIGHSTNS